MSRFEFNLPDLGEGTIEAEIVEWKVQAGDRVKEDDVIVEVMTEKASIELPSPVSGTVISTTGGPGDFVAVGAVLIVFETDAAVPAVATAAIQLPSGTPAAAAPPPSASRSAAVARVQRAAASPAIQATPKGASRRRGKVEDDAAQTNKVSSAATDADSTASSAAPGQDKAGNVLTSPSIRRRARDAGVDLTQVTGTGPDGRITNEDFEAHGSRPKTTAPASVGTSTSSDTGLVSDAGDDIEEVKVIGVRRVIAQRLSESKRNIPHFAYVEEIDVTELESLRAHLNDKQNANLTYLPFLALSIVHALPDFPQCNAHYDAERGVLRRFRRVHLGIAAQTPDGLKVPVVHDAQALSLFALAQEIRRVSTAARDSTATKAELSGSTITLTSLGRLGGIASTPIINAPEVGIIGVNKAVQRPMVVNGVIAIRLMMNLSASFDHRFVDGYDAAAFIQAIKERIEHPALMFMDGD